MEPSTGQRASPRVPFEAEVRIEFSNMSSFVSECVANISVGGMFVTTEDPAETGSRFRFELAVGRNLRMVTGEAEVVWVREPKPGSLLPPGMGVRFVKLDGIGRSIIFRIVDSHIQETGRDPFDLERRDSTT